MDEKTATEIIRSEKETEQNEVTREGFYLDKTKYFYQIVEKLDRFHISTCRIIQYLGFMSVPVSGILYTSRFTAQTGNL